MIRVAAVGDVHMDTDVLGRYRPALEQLPDCADVLLLAGRPHPARIGSRGALRGAGVRRAGRARRRRAGQP